MKTEVKELDCNSVKYEIAAGVKVPGKAPYSIASADIKVYVSENEDFDSALDDLKEKLEEAVSMALIVADETSQRKN